jgi:glycosyltransferase involved in cell wall biosynthesis
MTLHALDRAVAVSSATKADWVRRARVSPARVVVIPNGIAPSSFERPSDLAAARRRLGLPTDRRTVIAAVGRLAPQKGYNFLLEAVALLSRDYPELTVALAGEGPSQQELTEQSRMLGIADRVHFLGFQPDVRPVLQAADVFALPSLWEAMPYALLEAMASALPVVGTEVAGVPEVIIPGETGFLVPPRDSQGFAAALRPLLDSPSLRERMGKAGRERVASHFSLTDMRRRTLDLYRELLVPGPLTE